LDNWKKPFWQSENLTFREENNYKKEFVESYFSALNISRKNKDSINFIKEYKILHQKLIDEDIFDRDDEMLKLYNFLNKYINQDRIKKEKINSQVSYGQNAIQKIINSPKLINKKNLLFWWGIGWIILIAVINSVIPSHKEIKIDNHNWKVLTPKESNKYKKYEIFNRYNSNDYKIYVEKKYNPESKLVFLWYGSKLNWTYRTVNDWSEKQRDIESTCLWHYKYTTKLVNNLNKPIKEVKETKICKNKYEYKTKITPDCRKVTKWDKVEEICRDIKSTKKIKIWENCEIKKETIITWYNKKRILEKEKDYRECEKEWYQPTKQVENIETTIKYKSMQWQNDWYHKSSWIWTHPQIKYSPIINERINESSSKILYYLSYTIESTNWEKTNKTIQFNNLNDWKSIKDKTNCTVETWFFWWVSEKDIVKSCKDI